MSMLASFVQVDAKLLAQLRREPELIETLFQPDLPARGLDFDKMRSILLERSPEMMKGRLANLPPQLREQLEASLSRTMAVLQGGEKGEALFQQMKKAAARPKSAVAGKHGVLSLDKEWHGLHFILCGEPEPGDSLLSQVVMGGDEIGEDFSGYGPARFFTPARIAEMAAALSGRTEQEAASRFDPARMNELEIYPFGWEASRLESLLDALRTLRAFYATAAAQGWAVVTCLT